MLYGIVKENYYFCATKRGNSEYKSTKKILIGMEAKILERENEIVVAIEGRVDTLSAPELEEVVSPIWETGAITLVFDCEQMEYISSSGLRVVLTAHKRVAANGGKFILRNLQPAVRSVIDMTGFSRIIVIE